MFDLDFEKKKQAVTTSLKVAEHFEKRHDNVLRDIDNLLKTAPELADLNFEVSEYKDSTGRKLPMYYIDEIGFTMLAMGFTGEKALRFKLAYIKEFKHMEQMLNEKQSAEWQTARLNGKKARKFETDIIMEKLIPLAISQGSKNYCKLYQNYSKLVNSVLGIEAGNRENLPYPYIRSIEFLENAIENIISIECDKGTDYREIYQVVKAKCYIAKDLCFLPSAVLTLKAT
jgi:Rha family phage regulatory protein